MECKSSAVADVVSPVSYTHLDVYKRQLVMLIVFLKHLWFFLTLLYKKLLLFLNKNINVFNCLCILCMIKIWISCLSPYCRQSYSIIFCSIGVRLRLASSVGCLSPPPVSYTHLDVYKRQQYVLLHCTNTSFLSYLYQTVSNTYYQLSLQAGVLLLSTM